MKILFAASECAPFVKTGGLADVVGALPKALVREGGEISVALPLYREIAQKYRADMEHLLYFYVNLGWRRQYCGVERLIKDGITYYFLDNEYYFHRPYVYGLGGDEVERFAFFTRALLEMLPQLEYQPDVIHCHDWQTGLIPALLDAQYRKLPFYRNIATLYTIHNLQYQGIFPIDYAEDLISIPNWAELAPNLEFFGQCSYMKAGISCADQINTVSPTYAQEIQTAYYGERMDGLLRARADRLTGILNGIDTEEYDPKTDPSLTETYSAKHFAKKKLINKQALQRFLGLTEEPDAPLIGMVTRLSGQKGLDLIERVLPEIMDSGVQIAALGMGEPRYVEMFNWAQWKYPGRVAARIEMNHALANQIYAGSDLFLMPSKFEPCGLSQMIALRYGTLPLVRETGGLIDTVMPYNQFTGEGNGFSFHDYNAHDMLSALASAIGIYREHREVWNELIERAMKCDNSWGKSAKIYQSLYQKVWDMRNEK